MKVLIYNSYVKINMQQRSALPALENMMALKLTQKDVFASKPQDRNKIKKVFYSIRKRNVYLPVHFYLDARGNNIFNSVKLAESKVHTGEYTPSKLSIHLTSKKPRDTQIKILDFIDQSTYKQNLIAAPTGFGKSITSLAYVERHPYRTVGMMRPTYCKQWIKVIQKETNTTNKQILFIDSKIKLWKMATAPKEFIDTIKFIIISNKVYQRYLSAYEAGQEVPLSPRRLFGKLDVGNIIIDEVHSDLHMWNNLLLHTNVPKIIGLSGTFISKDSFITGVQNYMFPKDSRYDQLKMDKYISYFTLSYIVRNRKGITTTNRGRSFYNHNAYEKSLLRNRDRAEGFVNMIHEILTLTYLKRAEKGDKVLVFVSGIDTSKMVAASLNHKYPDKKVISYIGGVDYDAIFDCDIAIATPGKAGTAIDIEGLITTICTVNISSIIQVLQILGRLRNQGEKEKIFVQTINASIPKHREYSRSNASWIEERTKRVVELSRLMTI